MGHKREPTVHLAPELDQRLYYRANEVSALTGLSIRTVYKGIYEGWIPSCKIGNARLVSAAWLRNPVRPDPLVPLGKKK